MEEALIEQRDARGVVTLTMNRAGQLQRAQRGDAGRAAGGAGPRARSDESARVVVLAAAGKAFCPGHNLKEMIATPALDYYQRLFAQCSRMMLAIQKLPVPVIARVQGIATAAGCQLVAQCDLAVAADATRASPSAASTSACSAPRPACRCCATSRQAGDGDAGDRRLHHARSRRRSAAW